MKNFLKVGHLSVWTLLLTSCGKESRTNTKNVQLVGKSFSKVGEVQDRKRINPSTTFRKLKYPYNKIGILKAPDNHICTASLVGPNIILTAAHCASKETKIDTGVKNNDGKPIMRSEFSMREGTYTFRLQYDDGEEVDSSEVRTIHYGSLDDYDPTYLDWALMVLKSPMGTKHGHLKVGVMKGTDDKRNNNLLIGGYGIDSSDMYYQEDCFIERHRSSNKTFLHSCDTDDGDSGLPVIWCEKKDPHKNCFVMAVHVAGFTKESTYKLNSAVSSKNFYSKLRKLRDQKYIEIKSASWGTPRKFKNNALKNASDYCNGRVTCDYLISKKFISNGPDTDNFKNPFEVSWKCGADTYQDKIEAPALNKNIVIKCPKSDL